jgi:hypothetical protein
MNPAIMVVEFTISIVAGLPPGISTPDMISIATEDENRVKSGTDSIFFSGSPYAVKQS